MRLDDLPESGNVEDRRGEGGLGAVAAASGCRSAAADWASAPSWCSDCRLGARHRSERCSSAAPRWSRARGQPQFAPPTHARRTGTPTDESGPFRLARARQHRSRWKEVFAQDGKTYRPPVLVLYRGADRCAAAAALAQKAMGPFYCPADQKVYLDTSFFDEIETRFRGCERQQIVPVLAGLRDRA